MSNKQQYLVSYDISDPKRLRHVARIMEGYGYRVQLSVFQCPLDDLRLEQLKAEIGLAIDSGEDQVLIVCLGPETEQTFRRFDSIGRPYRAAAKLTIIWWKNLPTFRENDIVFLPTGTDHHLSAIEMTKFFGNASAVMPEFPSGGTRIHV